MKKTLVSLATASLIASSAMAADKGIDIVTTGQAAVYYNTLGNNATGGPELFDGAGSASNKASYGIQLNLDADLKNNFTFGSQITYLGTLGLEKNVVGATMQNTNASTAENTISDDIYLSKLFIAKKMGNTTVKLGRQELPKSLSPFAFSEGWNVFKNTFDASLLVNTDIPDTTVVAAYVAKSNDNDFGSNMSTFADLTPVLQGTNGISNVAVDGTAYMLTVQNKSIPMTAITATYYSVADVNADTVAGARDVETGGATAIWGDVKVAGKELPMGLSFGLQGGQLSSDDSRIDDTTAMGFKVGLKPMKALSLCAAYTSVDGDDNKANLAVKNFGTGTKTPLYTQMIANQDYIALDSNTFMLKGIYNTGDYGKVTLQGAMSDTGKSSLKTYTDGSGNAQGQDLLDIELIYTVKVGGVNLLAAYISQDYDKNAGSTAADHNDIIRFVARYNF